MDFFERETPLALPRKYHRPPTTTTKRRKPRKTAIPYEFEAAPQEGAADVAGSEAEGYEDDGGAVAVDTRPARPGDTPVRDAHGRLDRHVNRDYSYVRGEVTRIVLIAGFLVIALFITSLFR